MGDWSQKPWEIETPATPPLINYLSYLVQMYSVLCLYKKKVKYDISINLHDGNHGNQINLEMLTRVVLWDVPRKI